MVAEASPSDHVQGWWHRTVVREAGRNTIKMGERIGNIIGIFFILLFFLILIDVQVSGIGFFTSKFGPLEQFLFYGPLLYSIFPSLLRVFTANKNLARLADIIGSVFFIIAAIELLYVFPFDFPSLVDYLFGPASDALFWVTNDLARVVIEIGILVSVVSAAYNVMLYFSVREELRTCASAGAQATQGVGPGQA
jgi:hypothetical protein